MQQQTRHKKEKKSPGFLNPQMMTRTQILLSRNEVVKYMVQAMCHYSDKEMLVVPFNMGNHWLLLSISTTYDQVWYFDSSMPIDPKTSNRLTRDYSDVMSVLDE
jgi:hypothetical protein